MGVLWSSSNKQRRVCQQRFPKELRRKSKRAGIPTCGLLQFLLLLLLHSHLSLPSAWRAGKFCRSESSRWSGSLSSHISSNTTRSDSSNVFSDKNTRTGIAPAHTCTFCTHLQRQTTRTQSSVDYCVPGETLYSPNPFEKAVYEKDEGGN